MGFGFSELQLVFEGSTFLNAEKWCAYRKFHDTTDATHSWVQERNMCSISLESPDMDDRLFLHLYINCQLSPNKLPLPQAVVMKNYLFSTGDQTMQNKWSFYILRDFPHKKCIVWIGNMGVFLDGGTPKTPQNDPFSRKTHGCWGNPPS